MSRLDRFEPRRHADLRIGHVGLIDPAKLHPRFAELCAAVRSLGTAGEEVRFDVFGSGSLDALRQRFVELGLADRAIVHGHTEDLAHALSGLDAIGHPLAADAYATSEKSIQEAMWVGLPVVVIDGTGPADIVEHERTGLVALDEHDYPRQLDRLVEDAALRRRLGEAARRHAREHFDPDRNASCLRRAFEEMLVQPKRERRPLPGAGGSPARRFVESLGELAGPFAISLGGAAEHCSIEVQTAERAIAESSAVLTQGEGGVVHYRNAFPDDPHLRLWSGLVAEAAGRLETAEAEFAAAAAGGVERLSRRTD